MVDAAHDKESRARDTINQLKLEIANLTKLVEQGAGLSFGQENLWVLATRILLKLLYIAYTCLYSVKDLTQEKEELTKERDAHLKQIVHVSLPVHLLCVCVCVCDYTSVIAHTDAPESG